MQTSPSNKQGKAHFLSDKELDAMDVYFRACNYVSVGMIYLWS